MKLEGVEPLKTIIKCALVSPYIKGEKPISLMIVAKAESGKTTAMKTFRKNKGIVYMTDCTAHGIQKTILKDMVKGDVKTLMISDLTTPLARSTKTRKTFIAFLNNLIEEGIAKIETYAMSWDEPVNCNVITAVTDKAVKDGRREWAQMGFLSRFIVFSYSYTIYQVSEILDFYSTEDIAYNSIEDEKIKMPPKRGIKIMLPPEIATKLDSIAKVIGTFQDLYGIRAKINLRSLIKCLAYLNGRTTVSDEDYKDLLQLAEYMNLKYSPLWVNR